jgi:hypothetical protein
VAPAGYNQRELVIVKPPLSHRIQGSMRAPNTRPKMRVRRNVESESSRDEM